jgi:hypothetical protein
LLTSRVVPLVYSAIPRALNLEVFAGTEQRWVRSTPVIEDLVGRADLVNNIGWVYRVKLPIVICRNSMEVVLAQG